MPVRVPKSETRTLDQLREHYDIERELADLLRRASKAERRGLYPLLYDERNRRLPHHPGLQRRLDATLQAEHVATQMVLLQPFLRRARTFMEVGPGDCALSLEVSKRADKVYAVDVSAEVTSSLACPDNFRLILSDGVSIPVPEGSVDLAYSNSVMEHLHPDDAREQLASVRQALAPGGIYVCVTPHRFSGRTISRSTSMTSRRAST
ncbi:MAG: class I SAM-dependent methyltransferase [Armatimonadota bacterium]